MIDYLLQNVNPNILAVLIAGGLLSIAYLFGFRGEKFVDFLYDNKIYVNIILALLAWGFFIHFLVVLSKIANVPIGELKLSQFWSLFMAISFWNWAKSKETSEN